MTPTGSPVPVQDVMPYCSTSGTMRIVCALCVYHMSVYVCVCFCVSDKFSVALALPSRAKFASSLFMQDKLLL